jgi:hypothetical protein
VLDVYHRLHHNESVEEPVPFTVVLQTRLRFNSRLASLLSAADASIGISSITKQGAEPALKQTEEQNGESNEQVEEDYPHEEQEEEEAEEEEEPVVGDEITEAVASKPDEPAVDEVQDDNVLEEPEAEEDESADIASAGVEQLPTETNHDEEDLIDYTDDEDEGTHDSGTSSDTIGKDQISPVVETNGQLNDKDSYVDIWLTELDVETSVKANVEDEKAATSEPTALEIKAEETQESTGITGKEEHVDESEIVKEPAKDEADYDWLEDDDDEVTQEEPAPIAQQELEVEVDLIFDEDEEEGEIEEGKQEGEEENSKPASPLGKRSFDEHAEGSNDLGDDQGKQDYNFCSLWTITDCYPEIKRVKQSSPAEID